MRFKKWLTEAIQNPPHMLGQFIEGLKESIDRLYATYEAASKLIVTCEKYVNNYYAEGETRRNLVSLLSDLERIIHSVKRLRLNYFVNTIANSRDEGESFKYLKYAVEEDITAALATFKEENEPLIKYFKKFKDELEESRESIAEDGLDYQTIVEQVSQLEVASKSTIRFANAYPSIRGELAALADLIERGHDKYYNGGKMRLPKHGAVEEMYHATTALTSILRTGFKTRAELGRSALGGGPEDLISFTSDKRIADAIVWAIRRAVMIAQGRFGEREMRAMASKYGIKDNQWYDSHIAAHGQRDYRQTSGYPPVAEPRSGDDVKEWLFDLFRGWIIHQNRVYNPVFANVRAKDFARISLNDVGVVAAVVDMSQVKEYLSSMEEYRVPKSAIKKVWKVPYQGQDQRITF